MQIIEIKLEGNYVLGGVHYKVEMKAILDKEDSPTENLVKIKEVMDKSFDLSLL